MLGFIYRTCLSIVRLKSTYLFSMFHLFALSPDKFPGIRPPPIPASVDFESAAAFPKYCPSKVTLWNISQQIRRETSNPAGISEVDHIYEQLEMLSGGLKSGQARASAPRAGQRIDVVFWQKQKCFCKQSSSKLGAVCTNVSGKCEPLLIVFNCTCVLCGSFISTVQSY